jgi:ATP-dependent RNA helicase DeaD
VTFADLSIHPSLRAALAARGYETPTGVQAAVLAAASAGRDLLVSSQTGSGKTVAFGAALADSLLAAADTHVPHGPNPIALVIVPTRELAVQVREELRWLFAGTGLRLASCTGGTPVMGDLKSLQRGVDLVIGTPGRLVDLLRRQRLQLGDVRVVVLDEADEMLDLGFREDLEKLLQAAPAERRTLLLSATLPAEIRALARRYQRDALAIDPRKGDGAGTGAGPGPGRGAHEDITHRAHLIAPGDRLAAVVNVLRGEETTRAIVFCTTREGVAEMHAALVARGFAATAISGDRAQAERDRALEQLRRGDAQVLVATNVAARGLHLPDVDLIVHADLPLNADSLIHRSGRTGRAGRKGTAVVIATAFERRKAERLLGAAHVTVEWTAPPSAETIAAAARARLAAELVAAEPAAEATDAATDAADDLLARVEDKLPARELLRRLLARELARLPVGEPVRPVHLAGPGPGNRGGGYDNRGPRGRKGTHGDFAREGVAFRVNLGASDRADPRWLLPLICRRGGVTRREVGAIRIGPNETVFEIAGGAAHDFALAASEPDQRARHVVITRADAPSADARPEPRSSDRPASRQHTPERPSPRERPPERPAPREHTPEPHPRSQPARPPGQRRPHQPPRAAEHPRVHQQSRPPEHPRSQQARAPEHLRPPEPLQGGYHPLQRRVRRQDTPALPPDFPRPHQHQRPHEHPRVHPPAKSHERLHHPPRAGGGHGPPQRRSPEPPHARPHHPSHGGRLHQPGKPGKHRGPR